MHAVILAAGMGTRLGGDVPKPLSPIGNGLTLLGNQVSIISRLLDPHRVIVVVGYGAEQIMKAHPDLFYVYNPRYATTNTAKSLLTALCKLDDDVLWTNGDLYFESPAARLLIESHVTHSRLLVNTARTSEEEVKYALYPDGSVADLSKGVANPLGESLGMQIVLRHDRPALCKALEAVDDQDYFEKALEQCTLSHRIRVLPVEVGDHFCREVDFAEDLEAIRARAAQVKQS